MSRGSGEPSLARASSRVLPATVIAQLSAGSLWFGANAVIEDLTRDLGLSSGQVGMLLGAVNAGFIAGTLCYAIGMVADRF